MFSKNWMKFFGLVSFVASTNYLCATTYVTSSEGDCGSGTLCEAITNINNGQSASPIEITDGITATLTTPVTISAPIIIGSNKPFVTRDFSVGSGNLTIANTVALTPEVIVSASSSITIDYTCNFILSGPNNWSQGPTFILDDASLLTFRYTATQGATQIVDVQLEINGTLVSILTDAIREENVPVHAIHSNITLQGPMTFDSPNTTLAFGSSEALSQTNFTFNCPLTNPSHWTDTDITSQTTLTITSSDFFPTTMETIVFGVEETTQQPTLVFALSSEDSYTSSVHISGRGTLSFQGGTIDLSGDLVNLELIEMQAGTVTLSGEIQPPADTVSIGMTGGTLTLSGNNSGNDLNIQIEGSDPQSKTLIIAGPISSNTGLNIVNTSLATIEFSENISTSPVVTVTGSDSTLIVNTSYTAALNLVLDQANVVISGDGTAEIPLITATSSSITGDLAGSSGLHLLNTAENPGTLTLNSVCTYTGSTVIGDGSHNSELIVATGAQIGDVSQNYPITINSQAALIDNGTVYCSTLTNNGTLQGRGTINGTSVQNYGTTAPGNSPGVLTIVGDFTAYAGSVIQIAVESEDAALLYVSQNLTLDGPTLEILPDLDSYFRPLTYSILYGKESITGSFGAIELDSVLFDPFVVYNANTVSLTLGSVAFGDLALSGNAGKVAKAFDVLIRERTDSTDLLVADLLFASKEEIASVLNELQPSIFTALSIAQENNAVKVQDALNFRFQPVLDGMHCLSMQNQESERTCTKKEKPWHAWAGGFGDNLHQKSTTYAASPQPGYQENMGGAITGIDYHFSKYFYAGILGAYTTSTIKWNSHAGKGTIDSAYGGLYFSAIGNIWYANASAIGGWSHYTTTRYLDLISQDYSAKEKHGGAQLLAHLDTGINLGWSWFTVRPFDSFDYVTQTQNSFTEHGAESFDLSVQKNNAILLRNELGLNFASCLCWGSSQWIVSPKISWVREVRIKGSEITASFVDTDTSFTVTGFFPNRNLLSPGVSVTGKMLDDLLVVTLYYNGQIRGGYEDHSYGGQVRFGF
jgi:uncharacterized protein with beta-barrel porin domain